MQLPFGRTRALEAQVDNFLDMVQNGILVMQKAIESYLRSDHNDFEDRLRTVRRYESQADELVSEIETTLYTYSLLPENRGDVLEVLEMIDSIIDQAKDLLGRMQVELPQIREEFNEGFLRTTENSVQTVEYVVRAARSYLRRPDNVKHEVNKVDFYESETDRAALELKKAIFRSSLHLSCKQHLRYFVDHLENISDIAEDVSELVAIATIKRSV